MFDRSLSNFTLSIGLCLRALLKSCFSRLPFFILSMRFNISGLGVNSSARYLAAFLFQMQAFRQISQPYTYPCKRMPSGIAALFSMVWYEIHRLLSIMLFGFMAWFGQLSMQRLQVPHLFFCSSINDFYFFCSKSFNCSRTIHCNISSTYNSNFFSFILWMTLFF